MGFKSAPLTFEVAFGAVATDGAESISSRLVTVADVSFDTLDYRARALERADSAAAFVASLLAFRGRIRWAA